MRAIVNSDIMTITDCMITGNSTTASSGGLSNSGQLTLANSVVNGNTANGSGGGISKLELGHAHRHRFHHFQQYGYDRQRRRNLSCRRG